MSDTGSTNAVEVNELFPVGVSGQEIPDSAARGFAGILHVAKEAALNGQKEVIEGTITVEVGFRYDPASNDGEFTAANIMAVDDSSSVELSTN